MKALQAVQKTANLIGKTMYQLSLDLGKKGQYMGSMIKKDSTPSAVNLSKMLAICGYTLCAVPSDHVPQDAIIIDDNDESDLPVSLGSGRRVLSSLFDWEMSDHTLMPNESLYRVRTSNDVDSIYFTATVGTPEIELKEHVNREMMRHFGKKGPSMVESIERIYLDGDLIG